MLWHLSFGEETWDPFVLRVVFEMAMPTADNIRNTNIRLQGESRVAIIRNWWSFSLATQLEANVGSNGFATCWLSVTLYFHLRNVLKSNMNFRETIFRRFLTLIECKRNQWSKLTLISFVLSYSLSITSNYLPFLKAFFQKLNKIRRYESAKGKSEFGYLRWKKWTKFDLVEW